MTNPSASSTPSQDGTPRQEQDRAIVRLLRLLEVKEALDPEVMEARADLAEATARAGQVEDAWKQAEELHKDALRAFGEDHPLVLRSRSVAEVIRELSPPPAG